MTVKMKLQGVNTVHAIDPRTGRTKCGERVAKALGWFEVMIARVNCPGCKEGV